MIGRTLRAWLAPATLFVSLGGPIPALRASPAIRIEPEALDFGEQGHDEYATLPLLVRNVGDEPLLLGEIYSSCDCTKWSFARGSTSIPPGDEAELRIRISTGPILGILDKYVRIPSNDPRRPEVRVPVRASVHANIDMSPRILEPFYGAKEGGPVTQSVTISYRVGGPGGTMRLEKTRASPPYFSAEGEPLEGGRKGYRLRISLLPSAPEGKVSGTVESLLDGRKFVIRVHGEMFRAIRIVPNYVAFNRIDDPVEAKARFRLEATDEFPFEILEIRSEPAWLAFEARVEDTYLAYEVTARIATAERPEGFYGKIRVRTTHPEKPEIEVPFGGFFPQPRPPVPAPAERNPSPPSPLPSPRGG